MKRTSAEILSPPSSKFRMPNSIVALQKPVPDFALPGTGNPGSKDHLWSLKGAKGKKLVLYFYPRDNTPGCTQEGMDFRDLYPAFKKAGTEIVGISPDTVTSHEKFIAKMQFPFRLLADTDRAACTLFDVIKEKSMYGKKYLGVERSTFLIDAAGVLREEWRKVKVTGHAQAVLDAARKF
jgi:peroxiredoxin Q/BCP